MERITRKQLESLFELFVTKYLNGHVAKSFNDPNGYKLDYAREYGGYRIERICADSTGVDIPFRDRRRTSGEMWDYMHGMMAVLDYVEREKNKKNV